MRVNKKIIRRPEKKVLDEKEKAIFKSWHSKKNIEDIIEIWIEDGMKYAKLKDGNIIGIPKFTKQDILGSKINERYKGKTEQILSSSLGK